MAEQLATDDGQPIPVDSTDAEFAAAMATPPGDSELPAPPRMDPPDPAAPYGRRQDGKPKRAPGGRPPKGQGPRVTDKPAAGTSAPASVDYAAGLADTIDGVTIALAMVPSPAVRAQSAIIARNKANTITGLSLAAQNNAFARRVIAPLASGQVSWYILAAMALAPPVLQSLALWRGDPDGLAQLGLPSVAELSNEAEVHLAAELAKLGMVPGEAAEEIRLADELAAQDRAAEGNPAA